MPFRTPSDEAEEDEDLLLAPVEMPLDLRSPLRTCPSCGRQGDEGAVICVGCGFDWRGGVRLNDAHEAGEASGRQRSLLGAEEDLKQLGKLGMLAAATPLGVVLGPFVFMRSIGLERALSAYHAEEGLTELRKTRTMGLGGALVWSVLLLILAALVGRKGETAPPDDLACRQRLESVGAALRAQLKARSSFPKEGEAFREALRTLAKEGSSGLSELSLRCPHAQDLYPYRSRREELLTAATSSGYLLLWDQDPHPDPQGRQAFRGLRWDGAVEAFTTRADLELALRRAPFPGATESTPEGPGVSPLEGGGEGGEDQWRLARSRFLRFSAKCDDNDPGLDRFPVDRPLFLDQVGIPPERLLPRAARSKDPALRLSAARMLVRLTLDPGLEAQLQKALAVSPRLEVQLAVALNERALKHSTWIVRAVKVVERGGESLRKIALRALGNEAVKGRLQTRAILLQAAALRKRSNAKGDTALFPLPSGARAHAVALLPDLEVQREAVALLLSAGPAALPLLKKSLAAPDRATRQVLFRVLYALEGDAALGLKGYLDLVSREPEPTVQAAALVVLAKAPGEPGQELLEWFLAQLADGVSSDLRPPAMQVLSRAGITRSGAGEGNLKTLVKALASGAKHAELFAELRKGSRQLDPRLDPLLAEVYPKLPAGRLRSMVIQLLTYRPAPSARAALLATAKAGPRLNEDPAPSLEGLVISEAPGNARTRREAARLVARLLRKRPSATAKVQLIKLATGERLCGRFEEGIAPKSGKAPLHQCWLPLRRALETLAREGDLDALGALASHPTDHTLTFLTTLLSDKRVRLDAVSTLRLVSGLTIRSLEATRWRRLLREGAKEVKKSLRAAASRQRDERRARVIRARTRFKHLQDQHPVAAKEFRK